MLELVRFFIALVKRPRGKKLVKRTWKLNLRRKKNINMERQTTVLINIT